MNELTSAEAESILGYEQCKPLVALLVSQAELREGIFGIGHPDESVGAIYVLNLVLIAGS